MLNLYLAQARQRVTGSINIWVQAQVLVLEVAVRMENVDMRWQMDMYYNILAHKDPKIMISDIDTMMFCTIYREIKATSLNADLAAFESMLCRDFTYSSFDLVAASISFPLLLVFDAK